jgi:hypothetical protein
MARAVGGNPTNVRSYDLAVVYTAPLGTAAPTDTTTALNASFLSLGLLSEDGVTRTLNMDRTELKSMGGSLVRVKRTSQSVQFGFVALENIDEVFVRANPGSTSATTTGITTRTYKAQTTLQLAAVIHCTEGTNRSRFWIPNCEVFADGDTALNPQGMAGKNFTLMAYPDSAGIVHYEITDDAGAAAS